MIDSKIFEQTKNDIHAKREAAAQQIFKKVLERATSITLYRLTITHSEMLEFIGEKEMYSREILRIINEYLPADCGVTCTISSTTPANFIFEFDWLK